MSNIKNTFIVEWVGPFFSKEELIEWEKSNNMRFEYNFYIITGKLKSNGLLKHYCGKTEREFVYKRLDNNHKLNDIKCELNIWIARYSDKSSAVHNNIELTETLLISYWQPKMNIKKKKYYPGDSILLINRWFKVNLEPRERRTYPAQDLSDVVLYDFESGEIWKSDRLVRY